MNEYDSGKTEEKHFFFITFLKKILRFYTNEINNYNWNVKRETFFWSN